MGYTAQIVRTYSGGILLRWTPPRAATLVPAAAIAYELQRAPLASEMADEPSSEGDAAWRPACASLLRAPEVSVTELGPSLAPRFVAALGVATAPGAPLTPPCRMRVRAHVGVFGWGEWVERRGAEDVAAVSVAAAADAPMHPAVAPPVGALSGRGGGGRAGRGALGRGEGRGRGQPQAPAPAAPAAPEPPPGPPHPEADDPSSIHYRREHPQRRRSAPDFAAPRCEHLDLREYRGYN